MRFGIEGVGVLSCRMRKPAGHPKLSGERPGVQTCVDLIAVSIYDKYFVGRLPHKSVNLIFQLVIVNNMLTILGGG